MSDLDEFLTLHTISVERYTGAGGHGPVYAAAVTVACFVEDKVQQVRASTGVIVDAGEVLVSSTTIYADAALLATLAPGSRVTLWGTRTAYVINASRDDGGTLLADVNHCVAQLT